MFRRTCLGLAPGVGWGLEGVPGIPCPDQGMAPAASQAKLSLCLPGSSDLMPGCGGRVLGPGVLPQLKRSELNVRENERTQETAGT